MKKVFRVLTLATLIFFVALPSTAQVMQSSNYKLQDDSVNFGGVRSSSTSYRLEDTLGEVATGPSGSSNYELRAGYQQMHEVYLSLSAVSNVSLTPALVSSVGGTSTGSTTATVITDNLAGYELSIKASSSPALRTGGGATISDYTPAGIVPDYDFSSAAAVSEFGFSPEGSDIATRYKNSSSTCGTGSSDDTDKCWDSLTTSDVVIASRTSSNHPSGTDTKLKFRVDVGASAAQAAGSYTATTTLTLVSL